MRAAPAALLPRGGEAASARADDAGAHVAAHVAADVGADALLRRCASSAPLLDALALSASERRALVADTAFPKQLQALRAMLAAGDSGSGSGDTRDVRALRMCFAAVNDATFVAEQALVAAEFAGGADAVARVRAVVGELAAVERAVVAVGSARSDASAAAESAGDASGDSHVRAARAVLGIEHAELLFFRQGALVHAAASSVRARRAAAAAAAAAAKSDGDGDDADADGDVAALVARADVLAWACERLAAFRAVQYDAERAQGYETTAVAGEGDGDDQMQRLLALGMYSDTHVLSLVFEGELCYDAWTLQRDAALRARGAALLHRYLQVARLMPDAWQTDEAQRMLAVLAGSEYPSSMYFRPL